MMNDECEMMNEMQPVVIFITHHFAFIIWS